MKNDSVSPAIASSPRPFLKLKEQRRYRRQLHVRRGGHTNCADAYALHSPADAKPDELLAHQSQPLHKLQQAQPFNTSPGESFKPHLVVSESSLAGDQTVEPVAQAPMKQKPPDARGHRVFSGPWSAKSRGLPRRKLPYWMLKKSANCDLPSRPVRGRHAYAKPPQHDVAESDMEEVMQPLVTTLILPGSTSFRRYLNQRLLVFSVTDSVSVRRLREMTPKGQGIAIAVSTCVAVLLGLLFVAGAGYFNAMESPKPVATASSDSTLSASHRPGHSTSARSEREAEQTTPLKPRFIDSGAKAGSPFDTPSAKAGSVAKSDQEPMPLPVLALDEQQRIFENTLEQTILAMRRAGAGAAQYVRENEVAILKLQHDVQELISIRGGTAFSSDPQALALSRSLASIYLLIGQHQAARNLLLDLQETSGVTRSKDAPEMRLLEHLLHQIDLASSGIKDGSATTMSPLTPSEMNALLSKL
jgi:hypothetical protein